MNYIARPKTPMPPLPEVPRKTPEIVLRPGETRLMAMKRMAAAESLAMGGTPGALPPSPMVKSNGAGRTARELEAQILAALSQAPWSSAARLVQAVKAHPDTMSEALKRLFDRGLVERQKIRKPNPGTGFMLVFATTAQGEEVIRDL